MIDTQYSSGLASHVTGEYDLTGLSHASRVNRVFSLITMQAAVLTIGELEHTSDWDWRVSIVMDNGERYGTVDFPDDVYQWADTMRLPYTVEPNDYIDGFARWTTVLVETFPTSDSGDPIDVPIDLDRIATITIGYDT
jgi:hypothetical protein